MLIVFAAPRRPTAKYNTILESGTHGDGSRLGHFRFHCFYQKCGGKEEFKFSNQGHRYFSSLDDSILFS